MRPRKPAIYLWVIVPILWGGAIAIPTCLLLVHAAMRGVRMSEVPDATALMITIPAFIVWIPAALVLSNFVMAAIPSMRRIAQEYSRRTGTSGFFKSQLQLMGLTAIFAVICIPIIIYGFAR